MTDFIKSARPIKSSAVGAHYLRHVPSMISKDDYADTWEKWLTTGHLKTLSGLETFVHRDFSQGTTQCFDQFVLRHCKSRKIVAFRGEFQYHACIGKFVDFGYINSIDELSSNHAVIISAPFSGTGNNRHDFNEILDRCSALHIPVCLDLAYWGIAKNIKINLSQHDCVEVVCSSLSKPFYVLETHRVGIRFSRLYLDDGISMMNEVNMQNNHSMSLGKHFMKTFSCDWNWQHHQDKYQQICKNHQLIETDTIIFAQGSLPVWKEFQRVPDTNGRVGVSLILSDAT